MGAKEFIKDYILNQIEPTIGSNELNILKITQASSSNFGYTYLQAGEYIVFYENGENQMIFYIYNKNMELVKTETLTDNWINIVGETLKQDEDGNFYLLGNMNPDETVSGTVYYSLILLNNIIESKPEIRKWYKLSNMGITEYDYVKDCQKRVGTADYLITLQRFRTVLENIVVDLVLVEFNISVQNGNSYNTWIFKNYNNTGYETLPKIGYQYNSESSKLLIIDMFYTTEVNLLLINLENDWEINKENELTLKNGIEIKKTIPVNVYDPEDDKAIQVNGISNFVFVNKIGNTYQLVQYNIIDKFTSSKSINIISGTVVKFIFNNNYIGYITGTAGNYSMTLYTYELAEKIIRISSSYLVFSFDFAYDIAEYVLNMALVNTNVYNLNYITFVIQEIAGDGQAIIVVTDNSSLEYIDNNSLEPKFINLLDDDVIFSRNLTNKSIIGNQMNVEVNVPYSMLNSSVISQVELVSETYNKEIVNTDISKNIYESLFINFIKHINVIDNNFNRDELQNEISACLTNAIYGYSSNLNNYAIGYAKILKTNGEELVFSIGENAIEKINDYEYLINIAINGNEVERLQILAKDKKTVYVTIPLQTINKVILIKQRFKIEEG